MVPRAGFEPARALRPLAPEASASAKFRHRGEGAVNFGSCLPDCQAGQKRVEKIMP